MLLEHYTDRGIDIVKPTQNIVMHNVAEARHLLSKMISEGNGRVVFDLSLVTFTDSAGIELLVAHAFNRAKEGGGGVCLANLNRSMRELFQLMRFDTIGGIFDDVDSAVIALLRGNVIRSA